MLLDLGSTISLIPTNVLALVHLSRVIANEPIRITIADKSSYVLTEYATAVIIISGVRHELNLWIMPKECPFTILLGRDFIRMSGVVEDHST